MRCSRQAWLIYTNLHAPFSRAYHERQCISGTRRNSKDSLAVTFHDKNPFDFQLNAHEVSDPLEVAPGIRDGDDFSALERYFAEVHHEMWRPCSAAGHVQLASSQIGSRGTRGRAALTVLPVADAMCFAGNSVKDRSKELEFWFWSSA